MAQPKDELYCITDELGRSGVNNNGVINFVSTPTPLPVSPDGWQEKSIKYARNIISSGMWRTFTTPLKYVKDAALIVRDQLYRYGTERKLYQVIHRLDKSFGGGWIHKFFYRGELDLSQADDDDNSISVNIMEGDLIKLFKANENTTYEIDVDVPDAVMVKMDGHFLQASSKYAAQTASAGGLHLPGWLFINSEGTNFSAQTQTVYRRAGAINTTTSDEWILKNIGGETLVLTLSGFIKVRAAATGIFIFGFETSDGTQLPVYVNNSFPGGVDTLIPFNVNISLPPGEKLFSIASWSNTLFLLSYLDGELKISFQSRYKTTYIKGLRPAYVAQKLLDKITGGGYTFTSTYLTMEWENLLITSGDAIRAYDNTGSLYPNFTAPKLKISWRDFFEGYNVPCNLREGIRNQQLFIEEKADAFQSTIQVALGQVRNMRPSTKDAKEFQFNIVKIGYPNTQTEDVNGKDEFNVTQTYTSPITRSNKALELISKIIASMYEIEITRINLDGKTTTDDNNDNRVFFIHVEKTATTGTGTEPASYYKLLRNTYTSVAGLLNPSSAFNLELHPELCLYRHGNYLRGVFYWETAGYLVFQTSDKNGNVVVVNNGQTYIGNKNINIGSLTAPLFIPLVFKVEGPMPLDFIDTMDAGPDGTFSWVYNDELYYGFPLDCGIQPANRPAQETTLLCSPATNLNQLITISR
jgi:hypothetical protein